MTLLEEVRETYREGSTPVLETERLVCVRRASRTLKP